MFKVLSCITVEHDLRLVVLAGLVCLLSCFAAIDLLRRAVESSGFRWLAWIAAAGATGGCGVWATHFIAMLAYRPDFPVGYDSGLTALSLLAAIATISLGLGVGAWDARLWRVPAAGAIIGAGAGLMHYLGMWALLLPGRIEWSAEYVVASLSCGILLASAAIFVLHKDDTWRNALGASLLLTSAIIGLHFTAMAAVRIVPDPTRVTNAFSFSPVTLALGIAGVAMAVLAIEFMGALMDRSWPVRQNSSSSCCKAIPFRCSSSTSKRLRFSRSMRLRPSTLAIHAGNPRHVAVRYSAGGGSGRRGRDDAAGRRTLARMRELASGQGERRSDRGRCLWAARAICRAQRPHCCGLRRHGAQEKRGADRLSRAP